MRGRAHENKNENMIIVEREREVEREGERGGERSRRDGTQARKLKIHEAGHTLHEGNIIAIRIPISVYKYNMPVYEYICLYCTRSLSHTLIGKYIYNSRDKQTHTLFNIQIHIKIILNFAQLD